MVPSEVGETSEPGTVASFNGSCCGAPDLFSPLAQFVSSPYLLVTRRSPVTRSSVKKYPLRAAVRTSFLIFPSNIPSTSTGVCAES